MSEVSFTGLAERHALSGRAQGHSPATLVWYSAHLRMFDDWRKVQGMPDTIPTEEAIETFIAAQFARGLSASTVLGRFRALRAVLRFAESRKLITREENPIHGVKPPRVPKKRPRHVEHKDLTALLGAIRGNTWLDHRDRLILQLLYFSGLRLGEVCGLQIGDVDLTRKEVFVRRGKGAKPRTVPIAPDLGADYIAYVYSRPSTAPHLLLAVSGNLDRAGGPLKPAGLRMMVRRRCKAAGIPQFGPHSFRHGFAMFLRNNGTDLSDIAAAMGHTTTQVTQMYYAFTLAPAVHKAYNRALDRLLGKDE